MAPSAQQTQATGVPADQAADTVVTVRYWAAARAAAGVDTDQHSGVTVGAVVDAAVAAHPALERVAVVATFLVDGRAATRETPVGPGATVEVLPPFAGG
jgi:molybdopterin converting factor small subunit